MAKNGTTVIYEIETGSRGEGRLLIDGYSWNGKVKYLIMNKRNEVVQETVHCH